LTEPEDELELMRRTFCVLWHYEQFYFSGKIFR